MRPADSLIWILKPLCLAIKLHKGSAVNKIPSKVPSKGKIHPEIAKMG
jgi:hypothetical protein